jgi:hypothetical protein
MTTQIVLPFKVIISNSHNNNTCSINISLELISVKEQYYPMEDIKLKLNFHNSYTNTNLSVTSGDFEFSNKTKTAIWSIAKLDKDSNCVLKGSLNSDGGEPIVLSLSGRIDKYSVTGGSVTKVVISKNPKNINIYKGGKNTTVIKNLEIIF